MPTLGPEPPIGGTGAPGTGCAGIGCAEALEGTLLCAGCPAGFAVRTGCADAFPAPFDCTDALTDCPAAEGAALFAVPLFWPDALPAAG